MSGESTSMLYTTKQRKYVASLNDEDLRQHLLHQIRLRDWMESDRDRVLHLLDKRDEEVVQLRARVNRLTGGMTPIADMPPQPPKPPPTRLICEDVRPSKFWRKVFKRLSNTK